MNDKWKSYITTGLTATASVVLAHSLATKYNASCADKWTTLGAAGAVGSVLGAYEAKNGTVITTLKGVVGKLREKKPESS